METYADLNLVGYLYNICYGGFSFSQKFVEEINEERKRVGSKLLKAYSDERTEPDVISLFQKVGSEYASGRNANLAMYWVPEEFLGYVDLHEYDGSEHVEVSSSEIYTDLLKQFLSDWKRDPSLTVEDLNRRYADTTGKINRYKEFLENVYYKSNISAKLSS